MGQNFSNFIEGCFIYCRNIYMYYTNHSWFLFHCDDQSMAEATDARDSPIKENCTQLFIKSSNSQSL